LSPVRAWKRDDFPLWGRPMMPTSITQIIQICRKESKNPDIFKSKL